MTVKPEYAPGNTICNTWGCNRATSKTTHFYNTFILKVLYVFFSGLYL